MTFQVSVAEHRFRFPCEPNESVLDAAQRAGLEIPFSCRKGVCGTCKGRVISGEVRAFAGDALGASRARRGPGAVLQRAAALGPRHRAALDQQGRSVRAQDRRRAGVPPAKARRRRDAGASALSRRHPRQVQGRAASQSHPRQRRAARFLDGQSAARERRRATAHPPCAGRRVHELCVREAPARRPAEARSPVRRFHLARKRQADPVRRGLDRLRADQVDHRGHVHQEHPRAT